MRLTSVTVSLVVASSVSALTSLVAPNPEEFCLSLKTQLRTQIENLQNLSTAPTTAAVSSIKVKLKAELRRLRAARIEVEAAPSGPSKVAKVMQVEKLEEEVTHLASALHTMEDEWKAGHIWKEVAIGRESLETLVGSAV